MIIAPTWEMFERFTVVDGIVIGAWLMWVAWMVRATAWRMPRAGVQAVPAAGPTH